MRKTLVKFISENFSSDDTYFLTADLGYASFEDLKKSYGSKFINAGVSEQNMIGVAAGLAAGGFNVFAYSIAPFIYARPFEQVKNDVAYQNFPICLIGNGAGYGYGYMGPSHHAIEDCAVMNAIGLRVISPAFNEDIIQILPTIFNNPSGIRSSYLRLGFDRKPVEYIPPKYQAWRKILSGNQDKILVCLGTMAGIALSTYMHIKEVDRPEIWCACEFNFSVIPPELLKKIDGNSLCVIEEHTESGGLAMNLSIKLLKLNIYPKRFISRNANGYPSKTFGTQEFHLRESNLDSASLLTIFDNA